MISLVQDWLLENAHQIDAMNISYQTHITPSDNVNSMLLTARCAETEGQLIVWEDGRTDISVIDLGSGEELASAYYLLKAEQRFLIENILFVFMNQMKV